MLYAQFVRNYSAGHVRPALTSLLGFDNSARPFRRILTFPFQIVR